MSTTSNPSAAAEAPAEFNGVPVQKLSATIEKLTANPDLANFRFTAKNTWVEGTATRSTIDEWYGAGAEQVHADTFTATSDHPTLGHGHGPTPHEFVLHALASCIAAGVATTAANRGIELTKIDTVVTGSMDVQGILGIDPEVRNGFKHVDVQVSLEGDAPKADLDALISASTKRSAVFDVMANPTSLDVRPA
jgi:uncharacterized OsmC-like protein